MTDSAPASASAPAPHLDLTLSMDEDDHKPETKIPIYFPDGTKSPIELSRKACNLSLFFQGLLEDPTCDAIRLQTNGLKPRFLNEIFGWLEHHETRPIVCPKKPLTSTNLADLVPEYDAKFVKRDSHEEIFELMMHANYLQIDGLVQLTAAQIASQIKGRTPEEIMKTFNIDHKLTPEEEDAVRREFPDLFDDPVPPKQQQK